MGGGMEVAVGGCEQNEGLAEPGDEHGDGVEEFALAVRDGKDGRDGVTGPGANLEGVVKAGLCDFEVETESATEGAAKFGPIEFQRGAVFDGDGEAVAAARPAGADGEGASIGLRSHFVGAAAVQGARDEFGGVTVDGVEKGGIEGVEFFAELLAPGDGDGAEAGNVFEGEPNIG